MQQFDIPTELQFREESTQRLLLELYDNDDIEGLLSTAELLNTLWHQQAAINRWLAKEAAENLGEAWDLSRRFQELIEG